MHRSDRLSVAEPAGRAQGRRRSAARQRGFTLIEALITLLVFSVGLLGIASLQVVGMQEGAGAFRHSRADWLAYEMADRMRANLDAGGVPGGPTNPYDGMMVSAGSAPTGQACGAGDSCSLAQMAAFDSDQWRARILDLPNGAGTVDADALVAGRYRIRVLWDEVGGGAGGAEVGCPTDQTSVTQTCVELWVQP